MYKQIEDDFIVFSKYYKRLRIFLFISVILGIICFVPAIFFVSTLLAVILMVIFIVSFSIILYLYVLRTLKKNEIKKSKNILINIENFKCCNRKNDLCSLVNILKNYNIKNNKKVGEALRHYQTVTPRNIKQSGNWISVIALILSIYALVITDGYNYNYYILLDIMALILISTIFYVIIINIIKNFNIFFVRDTINEKMEDLLSEIYMRNLIYQYND